jgi:hypothetical protein
MKRGFLAFAIAVQLGCGTSTAPSPFASTYFLSTVDGKPLPVAFGTDGSMLVAGMLNFGRGTRPRGPNPVNGTVYYVLNIERPDHSVDEPESWLNYSIRDGVLRIDLCPPEALCLVATELVGPIGDYAGELVLTYTLGGIPGSVYRFVAVLLD